MVVSNVVAHHHQLHMKQMSGQTFADIMMLNSTLFSKIVEKQNFFQIQQEKLMVLDILSEFLL